MLDAAGLERYLHRHIPISRAMGITVVAASAVSVELRAALAPNLNHRSTAFGGSVASLAVLAGWSLLRIGLEAIVPVPQIVIQSSTIEYTTPVLADFAARCDRPADDAWQRFARALERRGRARILLEVTLHCDRQPVGHLTGAYVAFRSG